MKELLTTTWVQFPPISLILIDSQSIGYVSLLQHVTRA